MKIEQLGKRICIIGPSSGGKSTLAKSLGERLQLPVCYLDQLAHFPNTKWLERDKTAFKIDHDAFMKNHENWIMEGNYSYLMPERFTRASTIIYLDFTLSGALWRYLKRSLENNNERPGNLEGNSSQFSFLHIKKMIVNHSKLQRRYHDIIKKSGTKCLHIKSFKQLNSFYKDWNLEIN